MMNRAAGVPSARLRPRRPERVDHPWVFAGEIDRLDHHARDGDIIRVQDARGHVLGMAYLNTRSKITLRLLTLYEEPIDAAWWLGRLAAALARRRHLLQLDHTNALRLVHAEADGLPGLIVDRYGDVLVVQMLTLGLEPWREVLIEGLWELVRPRTIWERSDVPVRTLEGLEPRAGLLAGAQPPALLEVLEGRARLLVDVRRGQKTGMFLDQRRNRYAVATYAAEAAVLNCFAYSGGFSVHAALSGARMLIDVDSSEDACALADQNLALNGAADRHESIAANCFDLLREWSVQGRQFDLVILDPPAFTKSRSSLDSALRGYKEINLRALHLLRSGGILVTCSCSQHVNNLLFKEMLRDAAQDAHCDVRVLEQRGAGPDHPFLLRAPETAYLTCLIAEVAR
jgi:23S rRNA (cytosine1962-C5)-methyltransferase